MLNLVCNFINVYKIQAAKHWPNCLALYDALTTKQASGVLRHSSILSFFIVVDFMHKMAYLLPICGGFEGI